MVEDVLTIEDILNSLKHADNKMKALVEINGKRIPLKKSIFIKYSANEVILYAKEE